VKAILLPVLAGVAIFFGIPMLNEYSMNPCGAYNEMAVRIGAPTLGGQALPADPFGGKGIAGMLQGAAKGQVPQMKPVAHAAPADPLIGLTCTTRYWQAMTGLGKVS
jgi:hypothetical protein